MAALDYDALQAELKKKRICRFCLCQDLPKLTNIYMRDTRIKSSAPLPIQIMAIASIEVFSNDGMPCYVCSDCTNIFEFSYQFKQMCKKADNLLRQFPLTGKWPECLDKPILAKSDKPQPVATGSPKQFNKILQVRIQPPSKSSGQQDTTLSKKILNSTISNSFDTVITPDISPKSEFPKKEGKEENKEFTITFLDKIENNDELSIDDIHDLVAAEEVNEAKAAFFELDPLPIAEPVPENKATKPKLLNKSYLRILNKDADQENEPRISLPKVKTDVDGKMEIVAEILDIDGTYEDEPDPKKASPIETNIFPCPECDRTFPLLQLRDLHFKNHTRDRKFQCEHCEKSFFSKYDLNRHMFIHNGDKPYKCSACDKSFSRTGLLARHEKTHTDVPKFICVHCERAFISKKDMERHTERHNINRPFVCKVCNKKFAFKQGLERHEVVHSRQQPFSCQYCDLSFSTTSKLSRHLTAHAGLRPYPCKYCKKSYLLSHHLTRHLRSHRNVVDSIDGIMFICSYCDQNFKTRDELISHSKMHASSLTCPLCKKSFLNANSLNEHIAKHSEGEAFACEFCDLIFLTADNLQAHTDLDHTQEMEVYHADDRAQADKQREVSQKQAEVISDEKLQSAVNEFLHDDMEEEANESIESLRKRIKKEKEDKSPKIINQVIIQGDGVKKNDEQQKKENKSLLLPIKQRKLDTTGKSVPINEATTEQSPQTKRKSSSVGQNAAKSVPANRTSTTKIAMVPTNTLPKPKVIKIENDVTAASSATDKKVKVQRITVTKAQAAAMAKQGRIKIKDGKMILHK